MTQAMDKVTGVLWSARAGSERVVNVNVILVRQEEFRGQEPYLRELLPTVSRRTETVVSALP